MITQRPNPTALERSVRHDTGTLADIEFAKNKLRAALRELNDYAFAIGVNSVRITVATDCAEDILTDLFHGLESNLRESIERDERALVGSGV